MAHGQSSLPVDYDPYSDPQRLAWFDAKVQITPRCHLWTAAISKGYGRFSVGTRVVQAQVFAWERACGPVPAGWQVQHLCDVNYPKGDITYRRCVRLDHLTIGPPRENTQHMFEVGRNDGIPPHGEQSGMAYMKAAAVIEIRRRYVEDQMTAAALAAEYGTTKYNVQSIIERRSWDHLPGERAPRRNRKWIAPEIINAIRSRAAEGVRVTDLVREFSEFGIMQPAMSNIVNRHTYVD
jgi:hypothetical protein